MVTSIVAAALLGQTGLTLTPVKSTSFKVIAVAPGPGSTFICSTEDNMIRVINAATGATKFQLSGHPQPAYGLASNRQGTMYATGDESGRIWLWNAAGKKVRECPREHAHTRGIQYLSFSSDGKTLASTGADDFIFEWNPATGQQIRKVPGNGAVVESGQFSAGGFYAATQVKGLYAFSPALGLLDNLGTHNNQGMQDFAADAAGTRGVTAGRDGSVAFWSLTGRKLLAETKGHDDVVMHVAITPNGGVAASSGVDGRLNLWSVESGVRLASLKGQSSIGAPICFTGDGSYLVSSNAQDMLTIYKLSKPQGGKPSKPTKAPKKPVSKKRKR